MATQRDIEGWFLILQGLADEMVGAELPPAEAEKAKVAVRAGLDLFQSVFVDINRSANALESLAQTAADALSFTVRR